MEQESDGMSVIVKGMEMPKNCKDCPFSDHEAWCLIPGDWRERYYCPNDERSEYCPLIEVETVDQEELITPLNMIGGYLRKVTT